MNGFGRQPGFLTNMHSSSQNSNPPLSQIQPGGARPFQQLQPLRPFSALMHSSSLTLCQSQHQSYQANCGGSKPLSQLLRPGSSSGMQAATAGQALQLQPQPQPQPQLQQASLQQQVPATPPSQSNAYCSQPSQLPESEQMVLLGGTQQPHQQSAFTTVPWGNAHKPLQSQQQQQQQLVMRPGSSNSCGDIPASIRPGIALAAAPQKPVTYSSSLGKALGQELEGRRALEAIDAMQARLSDLEASCRSISLLGPAITESAAKLADLTLLHQQLACSIEGMRGMLVEQQGMAAQQQEALALVVSTASIRAGQGPAVHDAVVQTDPPPSKPAEPEPCPGPAHSPFLTAPGREDLPACEDAYGLPSGTSFRQRRSLVVRHSIQIAEHLEEEYAAGYEGKVWGNRVPFTHVHAQPFEQQHKEQQQQQQQQQQQRQRRQQRQCRMLSLGRCAMPAEACKEGEGTVAHTACPEHTSPGDSTHAVPDLGAAPQPLAHATARAATALPSQAPICERKLEASVKGALAEGGWIDRKRSCLKPALTLPPAKRLASGGVIARMSGKEGNGSRICHTHSTAVSRGGPAVRAMAGAAAHPTRASLASQHASPAPHREPLGRRPAAGRAPAGKEQRPGTHRGGSQSGAPIVLHKSQCVSAASLLASSELAVVTWGHAGQQPPAGPWRGSRQLLPQRQPSGHHHSRPEQQRQQQPGLLPGAAGRSKPGRMEGLGDSASSSSCEEQGNGAPEGAGLDEVAELARQVAERMSRHRSRRLRKRL